ncbi:hypothetical protein BGX31_001352 [Mortierella sp. GBA43]|nr:hypothetical protein BGX31_001352 [Mortierella sp. GBA43]
MGCTGSKGLDHGPTKYQQTAPAQMPPPPPYSLNSQNIPPSTLPPGWISQFDPTKQRLFYVYTQTGQTTWAHPNGQAADAQEMARFYQIQELQRQQYGQQLGLGGQQLGNGNVHKPFADSYNRMGGMGPGGAIGLAAGSLLSSGMHHDHYYGNGYGSDVIPAQVVPADGYYGGDVIPASYGGDVIPASNDGGFFGGGDYSGGDYGGYGGGDFGGGGGDFGF